MGNRAAYSRSFFANSPPAGELSMTIPLPNKRSGMVMVVHSKSFNFEDAVRNICHSRAFLIHDDNLEQCLFHFRHILWNVPEVSPAAAVQLYTDWCKGSPFVDREE